MLFVSGRGTEYPRCCLYSHKGYWWQRSGKGTLRNLPSAGQFMGNLCPRREPQTVVNVVNNYYGLAPPVEEVIDPPAIVAVVPAAAVVVDNEITVEDSWDQRLARIVRRDRAIASWGLLVRTTFYLAAALRRRRARRWAVLGHWLRELSNEPAATVVVRPNPRAVARRAAIVAELRRRWAALGRLLRR